MFDFNFSKFHLFLINVLLCFPPNIPQTAVDLKWHPCATGLVWENCQSASRPMPTAKFIHQQVQVREKLKDASHLYSSVISAMESSPRWTTGQSAGGPRRWPRWDRASPEDSKTNRGAGGVRSGDMRLMAGPREWPWLCSAPHACDVKQRPRYLQ